MCLCLLQPVPHSLQFVLNTNILLLPYCLDLCLLSTNSMMQYKMRDIDAYLVHGENLDGFLFLMVPQNYIFIFLLFYSTD